jgi:hypothetical protein
VLDQRGVTLFDALWAFYQEHEHYRVCTCGAMIVRPLEPIA